MIARRYLFTFVALLLSFAGTSCGRNELDDEVISNDDADLDLALPNYISGSAIQTLLNQARDKKGTKDAAGRYIAKVPKGTYLLIRPLIIYGNTHLDVTGIRIVARFPATGVKHTMVLNHVSDSTGGYNAPGNIAITGGSWDPVWDFYQRGVGSSAPPGNIITFIHTRNVLIDGVTLWNTKHWHAIELSGVENATVQNSHLAGGVAPLKPDSSAR